MKLSILLKIQALHTFHRLVQHSTAAIAIALKLILISSGCTEEAARRRFIECLDKQKETRCPHKNLLSFIVKQRLIFMNSVIGISLLLLLETVWQIYYFTIVILSS